MQDGIQRFIITNKWGAMPEVGYRGNTNNWLRVANGSTTNKEETSVAIEQSKPSSALATCAKTEDTLPACKLAKQLKQEQIDELLLPSNEGELENGKFNFELLPEHNVQEQQDSKCFQCNVCFSKYRHAFSLKRHFLRTHVSPIYISTSDISNCNINLSIQERVARDKFQELWKSSSIPIAMKDLYRCNTCADQFDGLDELKSHVSNHPRTPSSKRFPCSQCPMIFSHRQNLARHTSVHSGEKPYSCKYCRKGFPTATNQRRHERIHEGLKPYRCPHCASRFSQSGDLKKHIRKLHREFFHPCAYCLKYFDKETDLKEHVHSHGKSLELNNRVLKKKLLSNAINGESETPGITNGHFQRKLLAAEFALHCGMCEKRFSTRTNLRRHQRLIHSHSIPIQNNGTPVAQDLTEVGQPQLQKIPTSKYFASVSQNIAQNLQHHVDGKLNKSQQKSSHTNDENSAEVVLLTVAKDISPVSVDWINYNFPPDYVGSETAKRALAFKQELGLTTKNLVDCKQNRSITNLLGDKELMPSETDEDDINVEVLDLSTNTKGLTIGEGQQDKFGPVTLFICHACGERFFSLDDIEEHKVNNHPNVYCTHLEIEGTKNAPVEWFPYRCSPVGALQRCPVPPLTTASTAAQLRCTKCQESFQTNVALHEHILACGGHVDRGTAHFWKRRMPYTKVNRGMKRQRDNEPAKPMKMMVQKTKLRYESMMNFKHEPETPPEPIKVADVEVNLKCDGCNRTFKYSSVLERHQKACLNNMAAIARADALKVAQNQHSCLYCFRSFTYVASLKKHMADCSPAKFTAKKKLNLQKAKVKQAAITASKKKMQLKRKRKRFPFYKRRQQPARPGVNCSSSSSNMEKIDEIKSEMDPHSPIVDLPDPREMIIEPIPSPKSKISVEPVQSPKSKISVEPMQSPKEKEHVEPLPSSKTEPVPNPMVVTSGISVQSLKAKPTVEPVMSSKTAIKTVTSSKLKPKAESVLSSPAANNSKAKLTTESVPSPTPTRSPKTKPLASPAKSKSPKAKTPVKHIPSKCDSPTPIPSEEKIDKSETPESISKPLPRPTKEQESQELTAKKPKRDVVVKVENDSSATMRCDLTQTYTCPKCKRTFTYLANFKKHLADLCPLRDQDKENAEAQVVRDDDEEKEDDPPVPSKQTAAGKSPSKTSPGIGNKMNVSMWKHRLSNKMKTLEPSVNDSGSSTVGRTRMHEANAKNKALESCKEGEKKWSVGWYRGKKRKAPLLRYHRRVPTAKNSLPSEAISDNDTDEDDSRCESETEETSKSASTKSDKLSSIGESSSSIQREHISKYRKTILRKVKESTPSTSSASKSMVAAYDEDTDIDDDE